MNIEFVDDFEPEASKTSKGRYAVFAEELRKQPNRWAKYPFPVRTASSYAYHIRNGQIKAFKSGFDASSKDGELYVRYVGSDPA